MDIYQAFDFGRKYDRLADKITSELMNLESGGYIGSLALDRKRKILNKAKELYGKLEEIPDECLSPENKGAVASYKERIKNAFFVILSAFALTVVAMLPLFWAGAGMLKGFALTTIIGVSVGILITRPAFSEIVKLIVKD